MSERPSIETWAADAVLAARRKNPPLSAVDRTVHPKHQLPAGTPQPEFELVKSPQPLLGRANGALTL